jgi:LmbE family N-acetylglucosaminyl deacetylase
VPVTGQDWPLVGGANPPRAIEQILIRIRGLRSIGTVLHVGAHPDDEDAGMMVMMARKHGARVVYWSATRGESGQNRIGAQTGVALGIYRTWESLAARAIDGAESLFGPFYDFGYCTTGEEAAARWGREALVREIVRAIRLVQPQVLVARFSGDPHDGHGQHQAVGAATLAAFDAAADPARFTELCLPAWRTSKLYQSTGGDWQPGESPALGQRQAHLERDGCLSLDTGEHDPVSGGSYQQVAWAAFNCHRTQAMGFVPDRGSFFYYYKLAKSLMPTPARESSFYDGIEPTLVGLAADAGPASAAARLTLPAVCEQIDAALSRVRPDDASPAVAPLLQGLAALRHLRAGADVAPTLARSLDAKIASFEQVIIGCLGVDAECAPLQAHVAAGSCVRIRCRWWNPRGVALEGLRLALRVPSGWRVTPVSTEDPEQVDYDVVVDPDAPVTTPSWLSEPHDGARYRVPLATFACQPLDPPAVHLECEFVLGGQLLTLRRQALTREPFAGGYRELPMSVLPAASVSPQSARLFLLATSQPEDLDVQAAVRRHVGARGAVCLALTGPPDWHISPAAVDIPVDERGDAALARFRVTVPGGTAAGRYRLSYALGTDRSQAAVTFEPVWMGAPGLPRPPDAATCTREAFLASPASVDVHVIDARFSHELRYGYVEGAADGLLAAVHRFGLNVSVMTDEEMDFLELSNFDAILIGPNAYLLRDELRRHAGRFLDYVVQGGVLIVQYQAYGYELQSFAPYPFTYSHPHDRVTSPDGPVTILEPEHALMTHPNRIGDDDFAGWHHDRGLYFLGEFDERYTPILASHDPGEPLKSGGLVVAVHGRGAFVYVGYSLFRQIPAGVPGAFRLLANLLALPEALLLQRVQRLRGLSLFAFMNDAQLKTVARIASEMHKSTGTYLCRKGEVGQELFIVIKGEVEIVAESDGKPVRLKAGEGQVVGEFAILADMPRTADLRALTDVHLLVISSIHFRSLLREYAEIADAVIRQLVTKIVGPSRTD